MRYFLLALSFTFAGFTSGAEYYHPSQEKVPTVTREFRGAWAAVIYNIDWPSSSGLSAATQQADAASQASGVEAEDVTLELLPDEDGSPTEAWRIDYHDGELPRLSKHSVP